MENPRENKSFEQWIQNNKGKTTSEKEKVYEDDEFEDYFFDDEGFEEDQQLSLVDELKLGFINRIIEYAEKIKDNLKYHEESDEKANFGVLTNYITGMHTIVSSEETCSDAEIIEKIRGLQIEIADITMSNMDEYAKEFRDIHGIEALDKCEDQKEESKADDADDLF